MPGKHTQDDSPEIGYKSALYEREREIAMLKEIADAVSSQLNLETVFQLVAERARDLIDAETLLIPLLDEDCEQYTYRAGCGKDSDEIVGESLPIDFGICGWVWKHRRAWWRGVLDELTEIERNQWEKDAGTVILVPLIGKRHFLGGIAGINKAGGGAFDKRDLDLLTMFASHVSIAIENATAYEQLEDAVVRAEQYQAELVDLNQKLTQANKELESLALYDHLTGVANRTLINKYLTQALAKAEESNSKLALLMIDLDHFKEINDTLGHHVGDELLKQVCNRLKAMPGESSTFGRLGGDEFAVIIPDGGADEAGALANKITRSMDDNFILENTNFSINASIGIALYPEHGNDMSSLLRCADIAMYEAKRNKSDSLIYDSNMGGVSADTLALTSDLKQGLLNNELQLYYQPKIDVSSSRITGFEALARWPHPQRGMIQPDLFIPIMEHTGLIRQFTAWVLDEAMSQCAKWREACFEKTISINLSMHNLRDPDFPEQVNNTLKKWNLDHQHVMFEITESVVMGNNIEIPKAMNALSEQGIRFSIDDFGTGYSSLILLKQLPVSELKIDKSFVTHMTQNKDDEIIVRSTIDLAHNLGLDVVAEGVEDTATMDSLMAMDCKIIQGFLLGKPAPASELEDILNAESTATGTD
ncbi:MAG: bifunctional diguanylate cyclase/phosphodiesterase [Proteobacteria bacterium]|nr:bifunctional diguanylate cyclase/phosphodiesterase [Pseudomonadota bacterium]